MDISSNKQIVVALVVVIIAVGAIYNFAIYQPAQQKKKQEEEERIQEAEETARIQARIQEWEETLIIGVVGVTKNVHPYIGYADWDCFLVGGHLVETDIEGPGTFISRIAESWALKHKADGTPYTEFKIKKGLVFQDGTSIDAAGLKWALEEMVELEPILGWTRGSLSWTDIEVPDPYTLNFIHLTDVGSIGTLGFIGCPYYAHLMSPTSVEKWDPETEGINVVGAGPYTTVEWVHMEKIVLERWDDYPWEEMGRDGPFRFEKIIFKFYPDASAIRMAVETGEIDIAIVGMTKFDLEDVGKKTGVNVDFYESQVRLLLMDQHYEYFKNEKVRQAIAYVIDQEELVEATVPMCEVTYSFPLSTYAYYSNDAAWTSRYKPVNIAKANQLMDEAGYPDGFKTDLWICNQYQTLENEMNFATVVKEQLAKIGIDVTIQSCDTGVFTEKRRHTGEMPMALIGWGEDYPDIDSYVEYCMEARGCWAKSAGFNDSYSDELVMKGRLLYKQAGDDPARKEVYDELHDYNAEHAFWIPLYSEVRGHAWRDWLKGYEIGWNYMYHFHLTDEMYKEAPSGFVP